MTGCDSVYTDAFFEEIEEGSLRSARIIVPIIMDLVNPKSVIDVGCGCGAWLKAFEENGVRDIRGLDGHWVDESRLLIDRNHFRSVDLEQSFELEGKYDLAICLEVAEHLPMSASRLLVARLTAAAPLVLFSAAVPGQDGTHHVNEQWPEYWKRLFSEHGFQRLDPIRRHVYHDSRVEWWYRQNVFLFASQYRVEELPLLQSEDQLARLVDLEVIHKDILREIIATNVDLSHQLNSLRPLLKALPGAAMRAIKRRCVGE